MKPIIPLKAIETAQAALDQPGVSPRERLYAALALLLYAALEELKKEAHDDAAG